MTKLHPLAACLMLAVACLAATAARAADEKIDITGPWAVEVEVDGQSGKPMFTFKQEGEKLTGKYKGLFGEAEVTGKVKDKEIEFSFEVQGAGKVIYTGTIEDKDSMKGKVNYVDQASGTWKGKRAPDKK
jgi:hypothetical protein